MALPRTPEELKRDVARFSRHTDTAQRRHDFGKHLDLLADLDDEGASASNNASSNPDPGISLSDDDLMD